MTTPTDNSPYDLQPWNSIWLRRPAQWVEDFDLNLVAKTTLMTQAMRDLKGVGLAANQLGFPDHIFVYALSEEEEPQAFINAVITHVGFPKERRVEGCLSIPDANFEIDRYTSVTVEYQDLEGELHLLEAKGDLAQVMQHEIDHLEGIRVLERISTARKKRAIKILKRRDCNSPQDDEQTRNADSDEEDF